MYPSGKSGLRACIPVLDLGGDGDPDAIFRIAQNEVDLADRFAVDAVGEYLGFAGASHDLQTIRAKVRDENIAIASECQAIRKSAGQEARCFTVTFSKVPGDLLCHDLLSAVVAQAYSS